MFITHIYLPVPKDVSLDMARFYIMKIPKKQEIEQVAIDHSSDINSKDFMELYRKCTTRKWSFLVIDTTLPSDNPLRFQKNLLEEV